MQSLQTPAEVTVESAQYLTCGPDQRSPAVLNNAAQSCPLMACADVC